jgi:glycosyltransferase involved in cell wall biosynthesis
LPGDGDRPLPRPLPRTRLRVALDGTPLLGTRTGIGEVVAGLLTGLAADATLDCRAYALTWRDRGSLAAMVPIGARVATRPIPARLVRAAWRRGNRPRVETWTGKVDVVHATNYVAPPARVPVVVSVYDLGFVHHPGRVTADALQYPDLLRRAFRRGAVAHATSEYVARDICSVFGLPEDRVVTIHPGIPPIAGGDPAAGARTAGAERYVLALGTLEPRKNLPVLVDAFDMVAADDPDLHLVVAGADGWGTDAFHAARARAHHRDRIRRLGYVDAATRAHLLAGASLLAYPSRDEGFGFPPLEAMAAGVPVVAGRAGAIPEVVGGAALLVDPDDGDALAAAIVRALTDEVTRDTLIARGRSRATDFSWTRAAGEFAALYRSLTGKTTGKTAGEER